jgi:hypothetical protein
MLAAAEYAVVERDHLYFVLVQNSEDILGR